MSLACHSTEFTDYVVVGSGIAGLRAALRLAEGGRVLILTKDEATESATRYAQGGIAAAVGDDDTVELHEQDTLTAGDGLCNAAAVRLLVEEGPRAIEELLAWGAQFDRASNAILERTREGAHSRSRVLHAHGDSTGREIAETLARRVDRQGMIEIRAHTFVSRLLQAAPGERVQGVEYLDLRSGALRRVQARAVLIATGGLGQMFADTTNPPVATGDGPALAWAAGARLADMEFIQFHPTALAISGAPRFLLSEALRGEGAVLRNPAGERFMSRYHPDGELAPRDVVSRSMVVEMRQGAVQHEETALLTTCFLDASALPAAELERRFPRIFYTLARYGLDLAKDWIPIRPAAHYAMGGIETGLDGDSTFPGLYAAGEAACTGVHGANRLASNSLLEGLVFGARAGEAMLAMPASAARPVDDQGQTAAVSAPEDLTSAVERLRTTLSREAGVVRSAMGLRRALAEIEKMGQRQIEAKPVTCPALHAELQWRNRLSVSTAILLSALAREESRGGHFRSDFPTHDAAMAGHHSVLSVDGRVTFVENLGVAKPGA